MSAPSLAARRSSSPRGVARPLWTVTAACWLGTVALVVFGGQEAAHHDVVLGASPTPWALRVVAFVSVWAVMVGAMMLPTTKPMLDLVWAVTGTDPHRTRQRAVVVAAYLAVWTAFGLVALAGDSGVHTLVHAWPWLHDHSGVVLGATLVLAGAFQLSPLKRACLTACRSPMNILWQFYGRGPGGAWRLGLRHALYCLGCCWALMLVMFATGVGSLLWMLGLTAVMVAEKVTRWGARLVVPVGVLLVASGLVLGAVSLVTHP